jgi:hypothetical protein
VNSAPNPSVFGQTVVFTAVVIPASPGTGTPTGTVTFKYLTTTLGTAPLSGGTATLHTSSLPIGDDVITVVYSSDADFKTSTATYTQHVKSSGAAAIAASSVNSPGQGIASIPADAMGGSLIQDLALEQVSTRHPGRRLRTGHQKVEHKKQIRIHGAVSRHDSRSRSSEGSVRADRKAVLSSEAVAVESGSHRASWK